MGEEIRGRTLGVVLKDVFMRAGRTMAMSWLLYGQPLMTLAVFMDTALEEGCLQMCIIIQNIIVKASVKN